MKYSELNTLQNSTSNFITALYQQNFSQEHPFTQEGFPYYFVFFHISLSHVNNFTGTVYQSVLLSQKQHGRTFSMEESVQPNTSPAQWPGTLAEAIIQIFCLRFGK